MKFKVTVNISKDTKFSSEYKNITDAFLAIRDILRSPLNCCTNIDMDEVLKILVAIDDHKTRSYINYLYSVERVD